MAEDAQGGVRVVVQLVGVHPRPFLENLQDFAAFDQELEEGAADGIFECLEGERDGAHALGGDHQAIGEERERALLLVGRISGELGGAIGREDLFEGLIDAGDGPLFQIRRRLILCRTQCRARRRARESPVRFDQDPARAQAHRATLAQAQRIVLEQPRVDLPRFPTQGVRPVAPLRCLRIPTHDRQG